VVIDDHLLRDVLAGTRSPDLDGLAADGLATTGLWWFRLCASFAASDVAGKLARPVADLPEDLQARFRAQLTALPANIALLSMREIAWLMADVQARHRMAGRGLSAAMAEALAAAHSLGSGIAVSINDVGPNLRAAAEADGVEFVVV